MSQSTQVIPLPDPMIFREVAVELLEGTGAPTPSAPGAPAPAGPRRSLCGPTSLALETAPVKGNTQNVDGFGLGFYGPEWNLSEEGAHWTNGRGHAYFITRLEAGELWIDYLSPFPEETCFELLIGRLEDALTQSFAQELRVEFRGSRNRLSRLVIPVQLKPAALYCLTLLSPSIPVPGAPPEMAIGLGVVSIQLVGRPFDAGAAGVARPAANCRTRATELFSQGRYEEAVTLFHQALAQTGGDAELWNDWAAANMLAGRHVEAEQGFRLALAMTGQNWEPVTNLAVLLLRRGRHYEAVALLQRWLPKFPTERQEAGRQLLEACRENRQV